MAGHGLDVLGPYAHAVFVAQHVLDEELDRIGDPPEVSYPLEGRQPVDAVAAIADLKCALGTETVLSSHLFVYLQGCTLGSDNGGPGIDPVAELAQRRCQREFFVRFEDAFEELAQLRPVQVEGFAHPLLTGSCQGGEGAAAILWTRLAGHEAG